MHASCFHNTLIYTRCAAHVEVHDAVGVRVARDGLAVCAGSYGDVRGTLDVVVLLVACSGVNYARDVTYDKAYLPWAYNIDDGIIADFRLAGGCGYIGIVVGECDGGCDNEPACQGW